VLGDGDVDESAEEVLRLAGQVLDQGGGVLGPVKVLRGAAPVVRGGGVGGVVVVDLTPVDVQVVAAGGGEGFVAVDVGASAGVKVAVRGMPGVKVSSG
jgi:hypothetical protein